MAAVACLTKLNYLGKFGQRTMEWALSHPAGPNGPKKPLGSDSSIGNAREPGWANGLRRLYNSIVDEPLPDSFDDLLKKLDREDDA